MDDASDNSFTVATLIHYDKHEPRVRAVEQHTHIGVQAARNRGYLEAKG